MFVCGELLCHWDVGGERLLNSKGNFYLAPTLMHSRVELQQEYNCHVLIDVRKISCFMHSFLEEYIFFWNQTFDINFEYILCLLRVVISYKHQMRGQSEGLLKKKLTSVHKKDHLSWIYCFDDMSFFDFTWEKLYVKLGFD